MRIHQIIKQRVVEHAWRRRRRETTQTHPAIDDIEVPFDELPIAAVALRQIVVECQECHSLVLRSSTAGHTADHVRAVLEAQPEATLNVGIDAASGLLDPSTRRGVPG